MAVDAALLDDITTALHGAADSAKAPRMQAYMKSAMPYLGVRVPLVRALVRDQCRNRPFATAPDLQDTTLALWRTATFREQRYAAIALTGLPSARRLQSPTLMPMYDEIVVSGAWWDYVDEIAHRVGALLRAFPADVRPIVQRWARDPDRWRRRVSVICQLDAKSGTDLELLSACIDANASDPDFFIRKAIGWALRQLARSDPAWVRAFVASRADTLSPLSLREATKHF